jgi:hypothetical protein
MLMMLGGETTVRDILLPELELPLDDGKENSLVRP